MRSRTFAALAVAALVGSASPLVADGSLPLPPDGFKVLPANPAYKAMKANGVADLVQTERETDSSCRNAPKITFGYGWQLAPGFDRNLEIMAKTAQDPASEVAGTRMEPAGKSRYKNGLMTWKKRTMLMSTGCPAGFVTYDGGWVGYVSGRMVTVGVSFVSSKETGQAWIDEYIPKVAAAAAAAGAAQ